MKKLFLVLSISFFSLQGFTWDQNQVKECKSKFDSYIDENMALKFVCVDPATAGTQSSFIALQYSTTEYTENDQEIYLQKVIVCASGSRSASINQSNDLVSGAGLLKLIGGDGDDTYLNMMSDKNKRTLKSLSQLNCTDAQGRLLVD